MGQYPDVRISIPPGLAAYVENWDAQVLSFVPTGQECPRFQHHDLLRVGSTIELGANLWEIHAAPGHDPHSIILFEPKSRTLISADALWENGFGVVFQELEGERAFDAVAATLDLIERLSPTAVIPGHGLVFHDAPAALTRARSRLSMFVRDPVRHATYGAKVLIKYKLLEWQACSPERLHAWIDQTPYFFILHQNYFSEWPAQDWHRSLLDDLQRASAIDVSESMIVNRD
jgi:glyoxylase-like metal-dependent hydrolase (beta-lactamase superfamily II)